jgi:hypothetical protein
MRRPDRFDIEQMEKDAEIARLRREQSRQEEEARRLAEESRRQAEEARRTAEALRRAEMSQGWTLAELQARIDTVIEAAILTAERDGSLRIERALVRTYAAFSKAELRRAAEHGPDVRARSKVEIDQRFFSACLREIMRRDGDNKNALDAVTVGVIFKDVVKHLMETKIAVFGSDAKQAFKGQIVVDHIKFASEILKGSNIVLHAPTQCGKTACAGLAACMSRLMKMTCVIVVAASVSSVNQMAKDKMPDILDDFGLDVVRLDAKFIRTMTPAQKADVVTGKLTVIAHWNALELVEELFETLGLRKANVVLDESDELITNVAEDSAEPPIQTRKEGALARVMDLGSVHSVTSLSATQLGWLRFVISRGQKIDSYLTAKPEVLKKLKYRGLDAIQPLVGADGEPIWIPDSSPKPKRRDFADAESHRIAVAAWKDADMWTAANAYGIKSSEVKELFRSFNSSRRSHRFMFLSLGGKVADGFKPQAEHILKVLCPSAKVLMLAGDGVTEFSVIDGEIASERVKLANGNLATINQGLARYDASPRSQVVVLSQGCSKRGVSLCTFAKSINFTGIYATDGFNLADLTQLFGRCTGRNFKGPVVGLVRKPDLGGVNLLDEFTALAVHANMRGEDIMDCDALADPKFAPMLEMVRPFNRKRVLNRMPENEERMRVKRQRLVAMDSEEYSADEAGPSNRSHMSDPTYVPASEGYPAIPDTLNIDEIYLLGVFHVSEHGERAVESVEVYTAYPSIRAMETYTHRKGKNLCKENELIVVHSRDVVQLTEKGKAECVRILSNINIK